MRYLALLLFPLSLFANELPDAPLPKVPTAFYEAPIRLEKPQPVQNGPFFDRHAKIAAIATIGLLAWDAAQTCNNLAHGGHEDWLNTQKCGPAVLQLSLNKAAFWGAAYLAHRTHHHKLERAFEWAGPAWSVAGIASAKSKGAW